MWCNAISNFAPVRYGRSFSILWRISCGATPAPACAKTAVYAFQYSLANLVWCNPLAMAWMGTTYTSFSILWRISCGATKLGLCLHPKIYAFQYSLANLVWCNGMSSPFLAGMKMVSVFSGESRVVQPVTPGSMTGIYVVSVFSGESRVVQPGVSGGGRLPLVQFQYSLANLVWCNVELLL